MRTRESYLKEIDSIRSSMCELHCEAVENNSPVDLKFYALQKDLFRVEKNYRAWCDRHSVECRLFF